MMIMIYMIIVLKIVKNRCPEFVLVSSVTNHLSDHISSDTWHVSAFIFTGTRLFAVDGGRSGRKGYTRKQTDKSLGLEL